MVKIWFPQNTFLSWFFTGRAFVMVYYIIKLVLEFQFDLQNPLKQPKMWFFFKWKIIVFCQNYRIFCPKGDLKPWIIMACTFLPNSAQFFRFKNWCKITSWKKSSLTSARSCAEQVVKLPFFSKKCIFRAEKGIFSKSSFYTKMFSDPKYNFSVHQK